MAKNLKLKIKNTQIAAAVSLTGLKEKLGQKKVEAETETKASATEARPRSRAKAKPKETEEVKPAVKDQPPSQRARARSRSAFAEPQGATEAPSEEIVEIAELEVTEAPVVSAEREAESIAEEESAPAAATAQPVEEAVAAPEPTPAQSELPISEAPAPVVAEPAVVTPRHPTPVRRAPPTFRVPTRPTRPVLPDVPARERLGPTGRHVRDLLPAKPVRPPAAPERPAAKSEHSADDKARARPKSKEAGPAAVTSETDDKKGGAKAPRFKEYQDVKPTRRQDGPRTFDARDRQGLRDTEEDQNWRRRRNKGSRMIQQEAATIRPTTLAVRLPIAIKDLASEMKLKASQLIEKLFLQGMILTINDVLDDQTVVGLLGHEFGCDITIDTTEEERIRITGKTVREEITQANQENLQVRPPVVAFMGHVDHGKTSLIDAIRKTNRVASEAGAITQHIGAFQCHTKVGDITVLDTPGHEAFSAMRARGADVTDIVVLVVAGDEGIRQQTIEAIQHAKAANVTIVVALNKCDKPNFNAETVYRQLAEQELLPEVWGGQTITVNCSAVTGEGIDKLLEMLAIQSEVMELRADRTARARGRVLESEMHKGMGATATMLVQNGTLRQGDALVFDQFWGRVKTMRDDLGRNLMEASPSKPVEITGLSGLPEAGQEFIVVSSEREAREIAEKRTLGLQQTRQQAAKRVTMENLLQQSTEGDKKILNVILRADVQGSLEALHVSLKKIESDKVILNIIASGVGEVSESDVQLAMASKAVIFGFHSAIESHAEDLVKQMGVQIRLHDIIYHAIDDAKLLMAGLLDRIAQETEKGKAEVIATFKSSQLGIIAGCQVTEGTVARNHQIRLRRGEEIIWKGTISSLKRVKEDVREVTKGLECGIVLQGYKDAQVGDIMEAYEVTYIAQNL